MDGHFLLVLHMVFSLCACHQISSFYRDISYIYIQHKNHREIQFRPQHRVSGIPAPLQAPTGNWHVPCQSQSHGHLAAPAGGAATTPLQGRSLRLGAGSNQPQIHLPKFKGRIQESTFCSPFLENPYFPIFLVLAQIPHFLGSFPKTAMAHQFLSCDFSWARSLSCLFQMRGPPLSGWASAPGGRVRSSFSSSVPHRAAHGARGQSSVLTPLSPGMACALFCHMGVRHLKTCSQVQGKQDQ